jgi:hypothetical protein
VDFFTLIVGLLGQGIAWLGSFFEQTNQASVGIDNVADAGRRMGNILGAAFAGRAFQVPDFVWYPSSWAAMPIAAGMTRR